jgi:hypothetical protein
MLEENPTFKWVPVKGLPFVDEVKLGRKKPDGGFRDLLKTIKKGSPRSFINTY